MTEREGFKARFQGLKEMQAKKFIKSDFVFSHYTRSLRFIIIEDLCQKRLQEVRRRKDRKENGRSVERQSKNNVISPLQPTGRVFTISARI